MHVNPWNQEINMRNVLLLLTILVSPVCLAQVHHTVSIKMVRTGWNNDAFAIVPVESVENPAGCPTPDGYLSEKSSPGYSTYYAATLTAYTNNRPVMVVLDSGQCAADRPRIIGVNLVK
jgi:hypothetical protein